MVLYSFCNLFLTGGSIMNYASEDLINEHEGILYGLHILEKMIEMIKNQVNISIDELKEMVNFFKLFADKCHHGKEETMLFPEMRKLNS